MDEELVIATFQEYVSYREKNKNCGSESIACAACFYDWVAFNPQYSAALMESVKEMAQFHQKMVDRR